MADRLRHRGSDDGGTWCDDNVGIALALGHRRLSIVDLSPAGHQPMVSASGRYVVAYNGEIYNHQELRAAVEARGAVQWRGHSDTEVLLAAIDLWGLQAALERSVGMFAIGLWDRELRHLLLASDRIGEKPLCYGQVQGKFLFASELKAIRAVAPTPALYRTALQLYLRLGYVPTPFRIHVGLHKVEPGCIFTMKSAGGPAWIRSLASAGVSGPDTSASISFGSNCTAGVAALFLLSRVSPAPLSFAILCLTHKILNRLRSIKDDRAGRCAYGYRCGVLAH